MQLAAQEAWEARDTDAFAAAAGPAAVQRACLPDNTPEHYRAFARRCVARRIRILSYDDPDYPLAFSRISDMPLVLYCTGDPRWLNEPAAVGMVGTRKCQSRMLPAMPAFRLSTRSVMGMRTVPVQAAMVSSVRP